MFWLFDYFQNKVSADQYRVTKSQLRFTAHQGRLSILKFSADQVLVFDWIAGSGLVIILGKKVGVRTKATSRHKLAPGALLSFLPT